MEINWELEANDDLMNILEYLATESIDVAIDQVAKIEKQVYALLNEVSRKGKMGRIQGTMELLILGTKYIAVYRETEEEYRILRVLHSSQFHGFNVLSLKV